MRNYMQNMQKYADHQGGRDAFNAICFDVATVFGGGKFRQVRRCNQGVICMQHPNTPSLDYQPHKCHSMRPLAL